jgi:biopolymer transport protein TolR
MGFGGGGGSGVRGDINVTPLVDVVLVLLIIFLVTMPILMKEISVDVPRKVDDPNPQVELNTSQLIVELKPGGLIRIDEQTVEMKDLATRVREKLDRQREKAVFVDIDDMVSYGDAVVVMDTCKGAGATTVAIKMKEDKPGDAPAVPDGVAPPAPTP